MIGSTYHALCRRPTLAWTTPLWKASLTLKIKILVWQLPRDRLTSGTEVKNGLVMDCVLCGIPETRTHIFFTCSVARFLWCFVCEALGPDWEALDLPGFSVTRANQTRRRRRLFWLVSTAMTCTLWTTCNKMVIDSGRACSPTLGGPNKRK